jgi:hypothetical protein
VNSVCAERLRQCIRPLGGARQLRALMGIRTSDGACYWLGFFEPVSPLNRHPLRIAYLRNQEKEDARLEQMGLWR